jgi:hypothetical protein
MYDDENGAADIDLTSVDQVEELVRSIAKVICAEQPDMPEPQSLADMDSFSVVQTLLEVENSTGRKLLEKFENFSYGEEFRDLAAHIVSIIVWENEHPDWDPNAEVGEDREVGGLPETPKADAQS